MVKMIDFSRMYLVIELANEDFPMLIKLANQPMMSCTSLSSPLLDSKIKDGWITFGFNTHHLIPVNTIEGAIAKVKSTDNYGEKSCELSIDLDVLVSYRLEMLIDDSAYIRACRSYYKNKYDVTYE